VTTADAAALTSSPALPIPYGIIVNVSLRNALQVAEGLTPGSETLANVPSLTSAQVRAILSGQMTTLGDLYEFNPNTQQTARVDPSSSALHICRYGDSVGPQLAANIRLFGNGCSKGSGLGFVAAPDDSSTQLSGTVWITPLAQQLNAFVFAGARLLDVESCVAAGLGAGDTFDARIGFVSTDQTPLNPNWRYVALDGVAPTIWNIQLARYDWLVTDTFNSTTASLAQNGGPGQHASIFEALRLGMFDADLLVGLNRGSQSSAASADSTGASDTGFVTPANTVLYGPGDPTGPSAPRWPGAIREFQTVGSGPNNPLSDSYPGQPTNSCNAAYQSDPTG
jgi:hypothetical protein